ncbi:MAG: penicillin-binding protein 2 [Endomicrobium sp.]|jgi:penicillin-binding protein 2|nr:penicillin-binding protein 2 [Endomicrobium sp.]
MVWQREDKISYEKFLEKHKLVLVFFAFLFIVLSLKLFYMQIIKGGNYRNISEQQRMHNTRERAPRGVIYFDDDSVMVGNEFTYVVLFNPFEQNKIPPAETVEEINGILGKDIKPALDASRKSGRAVKLAENLTLNDMFKILEKRLMLTGISVVKEPKRLYFDSEVNSHVTGYTGEIRADEIEELSTEGYKMGDYIGRGGIEQSYDRYLQGTNGGWQIEVDAKGHQTRATRYIPAEIGASVYSTLNPKLQKAAYEALSKSSTGRGAAVVLDTKNGALKALVSSPGFDANKVNTKDFAKYLKDKKLPLFNRALQALYPPGSIFKIVTFAAAAEILDFNPKETQRCEGGFALGDRVYACSLKAGHGYVNAITAMAYSCNVFFYQLGLQLGVKNIEKYAKEFYLGQKTGIDLPNEKRGFVPNPEWKKMKMKMSWLQGDTVILAIGQGALWVTPLQMADMICAVANKGVYYRPYLVDKAVNSKGETVYQHLTQTHDMIDLKDTTWQYLHAALLETVEIGTGRRSKLAGIKVAGKTGTAENPQGEDHAWFVSYAPADKPEIAIAVIVENGGGGGLNAVPIARKIYEAYFDIEESTSTAQKTQLGG